MPASPFALKIIDELIGGFTVLHIFDEERKYKFAVSDVAIFCRDGSKEGKIQLILQMVNSAGLFAKRVGIGAIGLSSLIALINGQILTASEATIWIINFNFQGAVIKSENPPKNAGGYIIPEAKISNMIDRENAEAMIGRNDDGTPLIDDETDLRNTDQSIHHYRRASKDDDFKPVDNE